MDFRDLRVVLTACASCLLVSRILKRVRNLCPDWAKRVKDFHLKPDISCGALAHLSSPLPSTMARAYQILAIEDLFGNLEDHNSK